MPFGDYQERFEEVYVVTEIDEDLASEKTSQVLQAAGEAAKIRKTYLHVRLKSHWFLVGQKSEATAWTTSDKAGKKRVKVASIHLALTCHGTDEKTVRRSSKVKVKNYYYAVPGVGLKSATAIAVTSGPKIGPVKVNVRLP